MLSSSPSTLLSKISSAYQEILTEFPEIVGLCFSPGPVKHEVRHHVKTRGLLSPHRRVAWTRRSTPPRRPSSRRWRWRALFGGATRLGPLPFPWCLSLMALRTPVVIFTSSTMRLSQTSIPFPTFANSPTTWLAPKFSPPSTLSRGATKLKCSRTTSPRPRPRTSGRSLVMWRPSPFDTD